MRKGTPVKVIKDGVVIAVCENLGDAYAPHPGT